MSKAYVAPKDPRIAVTQARHKKLTLEAAKLKISVSELIEQKLKSA